jgi:DNA processing protein
MELFEQLRAHEHLLGNPNHLVDYLPPCRLRGFIKDKRCWWERGLRGLEWLNNSGGDLLFPGHPLYPDSFRGLRTPPLFLSFLGAPCWQEEQKRLSVVGAREPSKDSLIWMERHLVELFKSGVISVSGGARGVDQRAHALSLRQGGRTVVFLPSGLGEIYPQSLRGWVDRVIKGGGALISEYLPSTPMKTFHFHQRNRMIAAMGDFLLVVEAAKRSGSMMTANLALDEGRSVGVLPGHPLMVKYSGNLALLSSGAQPICNGEDILENLYC